MYTCLDCLNKDECKCEFKDTEPQEVDSFAHWCDNFIGCEKHSVTVGKYKVTQTECFRIFIFDAEKKQVITFVTSSEYMPDEKLQEYLKAWIKVVGEEE